LLAEAVASANFLDGDMREGWGSAERVNCTIQRQRWYRVLQLAAHTGAFSLFIVADGDVRRRMSRMMHGAKNKTSVTADTGKCLVEEFKVKAVVASSCVASRKPQMVVLVIELMAPGSSLQAKTKVNNPRKMVSACRLAESRCSLGIIAAQEILWSWVCLWMCLQHPDQLVQKHRLHRSVIRSELDRCDGSLGVLWMLFRRFHVHNSTSTANKHANPPSPVLPRPLLPRQYPPAISG
jgi:hypothetical protein